MLSAGFATITYLKSRLLPTAATEDTDWDDAIAALGKSVAGKFDRHCARKFARNLEAVDVFTARGSAWVLLCFPIEAIDAVEVVDADQSFDTLEDGEWTVDETCGLLETLSIAGSRTQKLRVRYQGGYWLNPRDGTAMPAEANELPDDVLEAWVLQCQHEAESRGLFAAVSLRSQEQDNTPKTANGKLLDGVAEVLLPFRRFGGE